VVQIPSFDFLFDCQWNEPPLKSERVAGFKSQCMAGFVDP